VNYGDYEKHLSKPRLDKYRLACNGDEQRTLELYMLNIELSKVFFSALSLFEVALRNAINEHYRHYFSDDNWILNQAANGFFMDPKRDAIIREEKKLLASKSLSPDNLVSALSFGSWTDMFSSYSFNKGNQTLLKIFPNRQKGLNRKPIYNELNEIRSFRNSIAHHEAICFDKQGRISAFYANAIWNLIQKYTMFLGLPPTFLQNVEQPTPSIAKLDALGT